MKSKCREIKGVLMQVAALLIFLTVCQTTCVSRAATDVNGLPADGVGHRKVLQVRNVPALSAGHHTGASGFAMCEGQFNLTASCPTGSQPVFDCAMPLGKVTLNASDCNLVRDIQCCSS